MRKDYVKKGHLNCMTFYQVKEGIIGGCRPVNVKGLALSCRALEETVGGPQHNCSSLGLESPTHHCLDHKRSQKPG